MDEGADAMLGHSDGGALSSPSPGSLPAASAQAAATTPLPSPRMIDAAPVNGPAGDGPDDMGEYSPIKQTQRSMDGSL